jgi:predicted amidohydrolase
MGTAFSNMRSWEIINKFYSRVFGIYNISVNRVGEETFEDRRSIIAAEMVKTASMLSSDHVMEPQVYRFWGGSEIVNPYGKAEAKAALYEEDRISGDISRDLLRQKRILLPYLRNDDPYFTHRELERVLFEE